MNRKNPRLRGDEYIAPYTGITEPGALFEAAGVCCLRRKRVAEKLL